MKVAIVGGGPAGLYLAYLLARDGLFTAIEVFERNPSDATFGFGVVFSDRALDFLRDDDPDTHAALAAYLETWPDITVVHEETPVAIDGNGFGAIGRLELLNLLAARAAAAGAELHYRRPVDDLAALSEYDLVGGADGANSLVGDAAVTDFGRRVEKLPNPFIWYGTTRRFETLTLTFRRNADGVFCAHHYRYTPNMSTFLVECDPDTFRRAGLGAMTDVASREYCEAVFAAELDSHPLISNKSEWRQFDLVRSARWVRDRVVLIGDAVRTAQFSIGSGTRLAMEDALALHGALRRALRDDQNALDRALERFEAARRPPAEKIAEASLRSARWYEAMADRMTAAPYDFAYAYMTRTGRVSDTRLRAIAPDFMRRHDIFKAD